MKKVAFLIVAILFAGLPIQNVCACPNIIIEHQVETRPKVALVLCGGGAKGSAHIGVLKVLEQAGVPIDMIVGTSMGAIIGGMYSMGYDANTLDSIISNCDRRYLLTDDTQREDISFEKKQIEDKFVFSLPFGNIFKKSGLKDSEPMDYLLPGGFVRGQNVFNLMNGLAIGYQDSIDFNKLPIPFACVATNLENGKEVILNKGNLPLALRASMAIPGAFAPVVIDGKVLVDGGVVNNFPVDVARRMGADIVIGVDVQNDLATPDKLKTLSQVLNQLMGLTGNDLYLQNVKDVDIYIKPDVNDFSTFSFSKSSIDSLIVNGYNAAMYKKEQIDFLVSKVGKVNSIAQRLNAPKAGNVALDSFFVSKIELLGLEGEDISWLKNKIRITENTKVSGREILRAVSILSGTKAFSNVTYKISKNLKDNTDELVFYLQKGPTNIIGLGVRYDTEEAAAILLHLGLNTYSLKGPQLGITGRLSYNPYVKADFSYFFRNFPRINFSYMFKNTSMNIYEKKDSKNYLSYDYNNLEITIANRYLRNFNFAGGVRLEHYRYNTLLQEYENQKYRDGRFYLSYFFSGKMDSRDSRYYPTTGAGFNTEFSFYHTNFKSDFHYSGALKITWEVAVSASERFTILPAMYARVVIGNSDELPYLNYLGGEDAARYMPHQLSFIGINYADIFPDATLILRCDFRQRIGKNHYVYAMLNYARYSEDFVKMFKGKSNGGYGISGIGLKYSYKTGFGPLSFNIHWSDFNHKIGAYINLGYDF